MAGRPDNRREAAISGQAVTADVIPRARREGPPPLRRYAASPRRWTGLIDLTFARGGDASALLARDTVAAGAVTTVLEEAVDNAARHGRASAAHLQNGLRPTGQVSVVVTDNGTGPPPSPRAGLGLTAIEAAGGTWALTRSPYSHTQLEVVLPTNQRQPHATWGHLT